MILKLKLLLYYKIKFNQKQMKLNNSNNSLYQLEEY